MYLSVIFREHLVLDQELMELYSFVFMELDIQLKVLHVLQKKSRILVLLLPVILRVMDILKIIKISKICRFKLYVMNQFKF